MQSSNTESQKQSETVAILSTHHTAFRCFDAEQTRVFYEDILGLKLAAALAFDEISGTDFGLEYMHLFFQMADGNFVAFFDVPDHLKPHHFKPQSPFNRHIALTVSSKEEMERVAERLRTNGYEITGPLDHGFIESLSTYDPNGLVVEIAYNYDNAKEILVQKSAVAHEELAAWTERTRARKEAYCQEQGIEY